jgi:hypothetical protein
VNYGVFERKPGPHLIAGWIPVRVKKTRQTKDWSLGSDTIRNEQTLAEAIVHGHP